MSRYIIRSIFLLTGLLFVAVFLSIDNTATGEAKINQNANTSTTTQNSNTAPTRKTTRRSTKSKTQTTQAAPETAMPNANVSTEPTTAPAAGETASPKTSRRRSQQQTNADANMTTSQPTTEQTDLSGTYTGTFVCDAAGLNGDTTLTITGNQFTTADGKTGRIVASTTHGYTAVALQPGDPSAMSSAAGTAPTIISLRARKNGNRLTL